MLRNQGHTATPSILAYDWSKYQANKQVWRKMKTMCLEILDLSEQDKRRALLHMSRCLDSISIYLL